jgi:excisionase family DNA binding protein
MDTSTSEERKNAAGRRVLGHQWDKHDVFTIPEAGRILRISKSAAYEAARSGGIPVVWVGRRGIVPRHALERLLGA